MLDWFPAWRYKKTEDEWQRGFDHAAGMLLANKATTDELHANMLSNKSVSFIHGVFAACDLHNIQKEKYVKNSKR